jgi:hypothetical protein
MSLQNQTMSLELSKVVDSQQQQQQQQQQQRLLNKIQRTINTNPFFETLAASASTSPLALRAAASEEQILEKIHQLSVLSTYSTLFLQNVIGLILVHSASSHALCLPPPLSHPTTDRICSQGLSGDLTQWLCSASSSFALYSATSTSASASSSILPATGQSHPREENEEGDEHWSIIWLDNYGTIAPPPNGHVFDFDTFQEVLETKRPNYINLIECEEGLSYQISYWPLFGSNSNSFQLSSSLNMSLAGPFSHTTRLDLEKYLARFESESEGIGEEGGEGEDHRSVIGILQCRVRKDSTNRSTFLEPALSQPLFLTYFNLLMSHIYPHLAEGGSERRSSGTSGSEDGQSDVKGLELNSQTLVDPPPFFETTVRSEADFLQSMTMPASSDLLTDLSCLIQVTPNLITSPPKRQHIQDYLSQLSQAIWDHSNHTQLSAVGIFLQDQSEEEEEEKRASADRQEGRSHQTEICLGVIRSMSLRTIQLRDDEENQSISLQMNSNRCQDLFLLSLSHLLCFLSHCHCLIAT